MLILVDSFLNIKNINVSVYSKKHNIEYIIFFNDILLFFFTNVRDLSDSISCAQYYNHNGK